MDFEYWFRRMRWPIVVACLAAAGLAGIRAVQPWGPATPVLVTTTEAKAGETLQEKVAVREIPAACVPPGALKTRAQVTRKAPAVNIPAGFVIYSQLLDTTQIDLPPDWVEVSVLVDQTSAALIRPGTYLDLHGQLPETGGKTVNEGGAATQFGILVSKALAISAPETPENDGIKDDVARISVAVPQSRAKVLLSTDPEQPLRVAVHRNN